MLIHSIKIQFMIMVRKWGFNVGLLIVLFFCMGSYINNAFISLNDDMYTIYSADSFFALNTSNSIWRIFATIFPFIIVFPFAFSYPEDIKIKNAPYLMKRMGIKTYFISKLIVGCIGGFLIIFIPFFINLVLCHITFPDNHNTFFGAYNTTNYFKNLIGSNVIINTEQKGLPLLGLYLLNPFLYNLVYLFMFSVFTGVMSMFSIAFSFYIKQKIFLYLPGFLFFYISRFLDTKSFHSSKYINFNWLNYVSVDSFYGRNWVLLLSVLIGILFFCIISLFIAARKEHL